MSSELKQLKGFIDSETQLKDTLEEMKKFIDSETIEYNNILKQINDSKDEPTQKSIDFFRDINSRAENLLKTKQQHSKLQKECTVLSEKISQSIREYIKKAK